MLRTILEAEGHACVEAGTAADALKLLTGVPLDLCLMDLHLPDGDGLTILRELRACGGNVRLPRVYLVTGSDTEGMASRALELGARGVLFKPFTPEQVLRLVAEV